MFVAIITLFLNGSPLMERQAEQHFVRDEAADGCEGWLANRVPQIEAELKKRGMKGVTIEARCDRAA